MESLKIAMLSPEFLPNWGGSGTYSILLARELSKIDDIHVFTTSRDTSQSRIQIEKELEAYFKNKISIHIVSQAKGRFIYNAQYQLKIGKDFNKLIGNEGFDLIHANHAHMPDLMLKLGDQKIPSFTTVHTTITSQYEGIVNSPGSLRNYDSSEKMVVLTYPVLRQIEKFYLNRCGNLICVSDFIAKKAKGLLTNDNIKFETIKNGVDMDRFKPRPQTDAEDINIMFCGRLLALKGLETLIIAFSKINREYPNTHLNIVGGGDIEYWEKMASKHSISKNTVTFHGQITYEEMPNSIAQNDIFVLPSYSESMPLALLESMASGLACIASEVGGIPEIITEGKDGYMFKPGDSDDLYTKLKLLISDKDMRLSIGRSAGELIYTNFNLKTTVKRTRIALVEGLNHKGGRAI